jgi:D-arabinose 1-dehydrogenase-like Zn-dependent alcohol dehydrogenase
MKASVVHAFGEAPKIEETPVPRPGPGQILVCVRAVSPPAFRPAIGTLRSGGTCVLVGLPRATSQPPYSMWS